MVDCKVYYNKSIKRFFAQSFEEFVNSLGQVTEVPQSSFFKRFEVKSIATQPHIVIQNDFDYQNMISKLQNEGLTCAKLTIESKEIEGFQILNLEEEVNHISFSEINKPKANRVGKFKELMSELKEKYTNFKLFDECTILNTLIKCNGDKEATISILEERTSLGHFAKFT